MKCSKCKKEISTFTSKGLDIKGCLLCGDCWNELSDNERDVMSGIKSKEKYDKLKTKLKQKMTLLNRKEQVEIISGSKSQKVARSINFPTLLYIISILSIVLYFVLAFFFSRYLDFLMRVFIICLILGAILQLKNKKIRINGFDWLKKKK